MAAPNGAPGAEPNGAPGAAAADGEGGGGSSDDDGDDDGASDGGFYVSDDGFIDDSELLDELGEEADMEVEEAESENKMIKADGFFVSRGAMQTDEQLGEIARRREERESLWQPPPKKSRAPAAGADGAAGAAGAKQPSRRFERLDAVDGALPAVGVPRRAGRRRVGAAAAAAGAQAGRRALRAAARAGGGAREDALGVDPTGARRVRGGGADG